MASSDAIMWSTTTPAARVAATISSPKESPPTGATRWVGLPSRARFSAMLRPTPPGVLMAAPGLEVRSWIASFECALMSMLAPPTTTTECASGRTM